MGFRSYLLYLFMVFVRPIEQFFPEAMALRPVLILWIVTFITSLIGAKQAGGSAARPVNYWLLVGMATVVVLSLLFTGYASDISTAIGDFSTPAMLFVLTALNLTSLERFKTTCKLLLFCVVILTIESLSSYYLGYRVEELIIPQLAHENVVIPQNIARIPAQDTSGAFIWRIRSVGFLRDPNDFAQIIVMVLPWLFMFTPATGSLVKQTWRTLPWVSLFLLTLNHTHSRGGMLGMGVMAIFALKTKLGNFKTGLLLAAAFVAMQVIGVGGGREISSKEQSANERIEAWADGMLMMKSHPLFGVGYGKFEEHHIRTAHNSYVLCFSELGLLGYFFWIGTIVLAMKSVNRVIDTMPEGSEHRRLAYLLRISMVGFLTCAWFLSRTYIPTLYILMAMAVSLLHCAQKETTAKQHPDLHAPMKWLKATVSTMVVSIIVVSIFIRQST
ncbi:MAG: O-antigen ligase domain-containing protein [Rubrivivax sp.]|nr:MAG: O-antigen ligase domain-containing protein [Rubrivivax sp.]